MHSQALAFFNVERIRWGISDDVPPGVFGTTDSYDHELIFRWIRNAVGSARRDVNAETGAKLMVRARDAATAAALSDIKDLFGARIDDRGRCSRLEDIQRLRNKFRAAGCTDLLQRSPIVLPVSHALIGGEHPASPRQIWHRRSPITSEAAGETCITIPTLAKTGSDAAILAERFSV